MGLLITLPLLLSPLAVALNMDAKDAYTQGQKAKRGRHGKARRPILQKHESSPKLD